MKNNKQQPTQIIDFNLDSVENLKSYALKKIFHNDAPEISAILNGHLLIERIIETLIILKMEHPNTFFKGNRIQFKMKAELAYALDLLPKKYYDSAIKLNTIRNHYAHNEGYKLKIEELNSLNDFLKVDWREEWKTAWEIESKKGINDAAKLAIILLYGSFLKHLTSIKKQ